MEGIIVGIDVSKDHLNVAVEQCSSSSATRLD
jgi:hypothetical protein